jgi:hypothetical protein
VKDSPADRSHLEPGDFIIFIDKINVVDMLQGDIQNLFSDKEALTLEVFRRANMKSQIQNLEKSPIKSISIATNKTLSSIHAETSIESAATNDVKRNLLVSKLSTDSKKRPLVTFSKEEVNNQFNEDYNLVLMSLSFSQLQLLDPTNLKGPTNYSTILFKASASSSKP